MLSLFRNEIRFFRIQKFRFQYLNGSLSGITKKVMNDVDIIPQNSIDSCQHKVKEETEKEEEIEIHPYWKALESRVVKRKVSITGKSGRSEVRKSDEDFWLDAGVYDNNNPKENSKYQN